MKLYLASQNSHKLQELRSILSKTPWQVGLCSDINSQIGWDETGATFQENSLIKAQAVRQFTSEAVLADDSGLVVEALGGEPGVFSSRYAGENASDNENTTKLLSKLKTHPAPWSAYFICQLCYLPPQSSEPFFIEGRCEGEIIPNRRGREGFGYDPVFVPRGLSQTFAEVCDEDKNKISHRAQALEKFKSLNLHL